MKKLLKNLRKTLYLFPIDP